MVQYSSFAAWMSDLKEGVYCWTSHSADLSVPNICAELRKCTVNPTYFSYTCLFVGAQFTVWSKILEDTNIL